VTANVLTTTESVGDQLLDTSGNPYNVQPVPASSIFPPGTGVQSTFVYRPGGVAAGNVYTTVPTLYAALNAAAPISPEGNRPPTTIQIDDSVVSPAVWPAGSYNLDSVTFTGVADTNTASGGAALEFAVGSSATWSILSFEGALFVTYEGTAAPFFSLATATESNLFFSQGVEITCPGGQAFFDVASASAFGFVFGSTATFGDRTNPVFAATGGAGVATAYLAAITSTEANAFANDWNLACSGDSFPNLPQGTSTIIDRSHVNAGTTAQRPTSPATGALYFDTTIAALINWNGTFWFGASKGTVKAADQSVTSSTVLVNENSLSVSMSAVAKVSVTWTLYVTMAAAAGIKLAVSVPTGATLLGTVVGIGVGAAVGSDGELLTVSGTSVNVLDNVAFGASGIVTVTATVLGDGTHAGNITLEFAQTTSSATSTTIKAGSGMTSFQPAA
jgi:hypothetical protein